MKWPWSKRERPTHLIRWCGCPWPNGRVGRVPSPPDGHETKRVQFQDGRIADRHFCPYKGLYMDRIYQRVEIADSEAQS